MKRVPAGLLFPLCSSLSNPVCPNNQGNFLFLFTFSTSPPQPPLKTMRIKGQVILATAGTVAAGFLSLVGTSKQFSFLFSFYWKDYP